MASIHGIISEDGVELFNTEASYRDLETSVFPWTRGTSSSGGDKHDVNNANNNTGSVIPNSMQDKINKFHAIFG